jgi:hypothetical protein
MLSKKKRKSLNQAAKNLKTSNEMESLNKILSDLATRRNAAIDRVAPAIN